MVHVIEALAVEAANDVHYVFEYNGPMECSRLWRVASCINFCEPTLLNVKLMDVVKSLLVGIDATENVNIAAANHGRVSVTRLRWRSICSMNLIPIIGQKTILENVVHGVMAIPATEDEH